jgi:hypothetical protein
MSDFIKIWVKASVGTTAAVAAILASATAPAASVAVAPGGSLYLTDTNSGNNNSANPGTGTFSALSGAGSYTYANGFTSQQTTDFSTSTNGFYDDYIITIGAGQVDSITSTVTIGSAAGISGMQVRLYDYAANGDTAPLLTTPVAGSAFDSWSTTIPISPGNSATYNVLPTTTLTAGTYVVEVRGTASGANGGAYSGTLDFTPVPLPGGLPLVLSGLGLLTGLTVRRRAAAAH